MIALPSHLVSSVGKRYSFPAQAWGALLIVGLILLLSGCVTAAKRVPAATELAPGVTKVPARILSNFFLIEVKQDDSKTYRFLVDTGSSVTLVSPSTAAALKQRTWSWPWSKKKPGPTIPVRGARHVEVELPAVNLHQLRVGDARFHHVLAGVYDFSDLSAHLGLTIDGVIGFPLFNDAYLTLDYPKTTLEISSNTPLDPTPVFPVGTTTIPYNREQPTPLIPVQMGNESFFVLIDSGSDGGLALNPSGLHPTFTHGPRVGMIVSSLDGDKRQMVGRLEQDVKIGDQTVQRPVVDLTEQLSSLGGELLQYFRLTFDQHRRQVALERPDDGPVEMPGRRSTGLSFRRFPNYWRLLAVVPDTPNSGIPVQAGDLCVRINGELVEKWTFERYADLVKSASSIKYTFLSGSTEVEHEVKVFELVP